MGIGIPQWFITSILYSKFTIFSRLIRIFEYFCKMCRFLCQHRYVNLSKNRTNVFVIFNYPTRYWGFYQEISQNIVIARSPATNCRKVNFIYLLCTMNKYS